MAAEQAKSQRSRQIVDFSLPPQLAKTVKAGAERHNATLRVLLEEMRR
jgi:hypothetical protein